MKRLLWVVIAALILLAGIWSRTKVMAYNAVEDKKNYYEIEETQAIARMREVLNRAGYSNSGITMTKQMPKEGTRIYRILIHHQAFAHADETEQAKICFALEQQTFGPAAGDQVEFAVCLEY